MRRLLGNNNSVAVDTSAPSAGSPPTTTPRTPTTPYGGGGSNKQANDAQPSQPASATKRALQTFGNIAASYTSRAASINSGSRKEGTEDGVVKKDLFPQDTLHPVVRSSNDKYNGTATALVHEIRLPDLSVTLERSSSSLAQGEQPLTTTQPNKKPEDGSEIREETSKGKMPPPFDQIDPDWDDAFKLPFSSSLRRPSASASSTSTATAVGSPGLPSHPSPPSNGLSSSSSGFTTKGTQYGINSGMAVASAYAINASSLVDLKDEMMMELLSSDALLHVGQFEILGFDEVEELRKEHCILVNRLSSLSNKLNIEIKIRDASISISKLYSSKRLSRQADDNLTLQNKKIDNLENEYHRLGNREAEIRTRVLKHMAAVLALVLRKYEGASIPQPHGVPPNGHVASGSLSPQSRLGASATSSMAFPPPLPLKTPAKNDNNALAAVQGAGGSISAIFDPTLLSPKAIASPTFSSPLASSQRSSPTGQRAAVAKFEGPHLFANNRDATLPFHPKSPYLDSPYQFSRSTFSGSTSSASNVNPTGGLVSPPLTTSTSHLAYGGLSSPGMEGELASEVKELKARLQAQQTILDSLRQERDSLLDKVAQVQDQRDVAREESSADHERDLEEVRNALNTAQTQASTHRQQASDLERRYQDLQERCDRDEQEHVQALLKTLNRHSGSESVLATHLKPPASQDLSFLVAEHLDILLSDIGEAYQRVLHENELLTDQLSSEQGQKTRSAEEKSGTEAKRAMLLEGELRQLRQEHQTLVEQLKATEDAKMEADAKTESLGAERQELAAAIKNERAEAEASAVQRIQESEDYFHSKLSESEAALLANTRQVEEHRSTIEALEGKLEESQKANDQITKALTQIWTDLPDLNHLAKIKELKNNENLSETAKPLSSPSPTKRQFSVDGLAAHLEALMASHGALVERLYSEDTRAASLDDTVQQLQSRVEEKDKILQSYSEELRVLQEQMTLAANKEGQMLERLNDLQDQLEQSRLASKRAEADLKEMAKRCSVLEREKMQLIHRPGEASKVEKMEKEIEELREDLIMAQDELDEVKNKESRQRVQMLDELTSLTEEASSLRTQLRAAQRKLAAAANARV